MNFTDLFAGARKATADAEDQYRKIRRKREDVRRERDALKARPVVAGDLKAMLAGFVREQRAAYLQQLAANLKPFVNRPDYIEHAPTRKSVLTIVGVAAGPGADVVSIKDADQALCALLGDQLIAALDRAVDELPLPAGGLSNVERDRQVAKLDGRIADFDRQLEEIAAAALSAGVRLNVDRPEDF